MNIKYTLRLEYSMRNKLHICTLVELTDFAHIFRWKSYWSKPQHSNRIANAYFHSFIRVQLHQPYVYSWFDLVGTSIWAFKWNRTTGLSVCSEWMNANVIGSRKQAILFQQRRILLLRRPLKLNIFKASPSNR